MGGREGQESAIYYPGTGGKFAGPPSGLVPSGAFRWFAQATAKYGGLPGGGEGRVPLSALPREWLGDPRYGGFIDWLKGQGIISPEQPPSYEVTPPGGEAPPSETPPAPPGGEPPYFPPSEPPGAGGGAGEEPPPVGGDGLPPEGGEEFFPIPEPPVASGGGGPFEDVPPGGIPPEPPKPSGPFEDVPPGYPGALPSTGPFEDVPSGEGEEGEEEEIPFFPEPERERRHPV